MSEPKQKHIKENFSHVDLRGSNVTNQDFLECDFSYSDCSDMVFAGCNLYKSDFTGAKMAGAVVSLSCFTFRDVKLDNQQVEYLLYLLTLADIPNIQLRNIVQLITPERKEKLDRLFQQK